MMNSSRKWKMLGFIRRMRILEMTIAHTGTKVESALFPGLWESTSNIQMKKHNEICEAYSQYCPPKDRRSIKSPLVKLEIELSHGLIRPSDAALAWVAFLSEKRQKREGEILLQVSDIFAEGYHPLPYVTTDEICMYLSIIVQVGNDKSSAVNDYWAHGRTLFSNREMKQINTHSEISTVQAYQ
jgi:hypothetical protein